MRIILIIKLITVIRHYAFNVNIVHVLIGDEFHLMIYTCNIIIRNYNIISNILN